jgi:putative peptidoglycan lipid II flippase
MKLTFVLVIIFTLIGKITGFLREIIMSARIGANIYTDIYHYSITASTIMTSIVVIGIGTALIPMLSEAEVEGRMESFFNKLLSALLPLLLLGVGILYVLSPGLLYLIAPGLSSTMRPLAVQYSRILSVNFLSVSMQAMFIGYLQKNKRFFFPASMSIPLNTSIILGILFSDPNNILPMVIATAVGQLLCLLWLSIPLKKINFSPKLAIKPHFFSDSLGIQFMQMLPPVLIGLAANQLNALIDRSLSSLLPAGNASLLNYADRLQGIVYSIMIVSLMTVLFPKQAEYASKKEYKKLFSLTRENLSIILILVFPLAFGLMFLSQEVTKIAFLRNQFTPRDALITGNILLCYGGIVLFQSPAEILSRTFYALKETKKQMSASIVSILTNLTMNLVLLKPLGVYGLALATTFATFVRVVMLTRMIKPYFLQQNEHIFSRSIIKYFIASSSMILVLFGFRKLVSSILGLYGYTFFSVIIGATVYFIVLFLLRTNELIQLRDMAIGFVKRIRRNA